VMYETPMKFVQHLKCSTMDEKIFASVSGSSKEIIVWHQGFSRPLWSKKCLVWTYSQNYFYEDKKSKPVCIWISARSIIRIYVYICFVANWRHCLDS